MRTNDMTHDTRRHAQPDIQPTNQEYVLKYLLPSWEEKRTEGRVGADDSSTNWLGNSVARAPFMNWGCPGFDPQSSPFFLFLQVEPGNSSLVLFWKGAFAIAPLRYPSR